MKPLSYDATWNDLAGMARANASVLTVMAGVFFLLPNFAQAIWAPPPQIKALDWNGIKQLNEYFVANFPVLLLCQIPVWLGTAALLTLLLDSRRLSVGESLRAAAALLIAVVVLNWLTQLAVFAGMLALVLPGLYLLGRLSVAAPAQMAERLVNPVTPMRRSFDLTRGNGWRIAALVVLITLVAAVAGSAIGSVMGVLIGVSLPDALAVPIDALLRAVLSAATALLMVLLSAALYRQLTANR